MYIRYIYIVYTIIDILYIHILYIKLVKVTDDIQSDHIVHHMPKCMSYNEAIGGLVITGTAHSVFLAAYILYIFILYIIYYMLYIYILYKGIYIILHIIE